MPLIAYYSDNLDHHSAADRDKVREWLKLEFNAELVTINGVLHKIGKSTSGRNVFTPYVERVMDWFIPNYEPPQQAIDPEYFKHWRDTIRSFEDGPENYIDYLQQTGILKPKPTQ
ncbi:MAG: hypothetical protein E6Q97_08505 [Desulfurellales bacterium]|nr:MAG: hypothetical protein E6Q97_08505 [Desulfurellales bacterium]